MSDYVEYFFAPNNSGEGEAPSPKAAVRDFFYPSESKSGAGQAEPHAAPGVRGFWRSVEPSERRDGEEPAPQARQYWYTVDPREGAGSSDGAPNPAKARYYFDPASDSTSAGKAPGRVSLGWAPKASGKPPEGQWSSECPPQPTESPKAGGNPFDVSFEWKSAHSYEFPAGFEHADWEVQEFEVPAVFDSISPFEGVPEYEAIVDFEVPVDFQFSTDFVAPGGHESSAASSWLKAVQGEFQPLGQNEAPPSKATGGTPAGRIDFTEYSSVPVPSPSKGEADFGGAEPIEKHIQRLEAQLDALKKKLEGSEKRRLNL